MKHLSYGMAALVVVAILLAGMAGVLLLGVPTADAAPAAQYVPPRTVTLYGPTAVTTGTVFSASPLTVQGIDNSRVTNYQHLDLFAVTGANSSGTVTVTVQYSPDAVIWANATETAYTFNTTGTLTTNAVVQRIVLSGAAATGLESVPVAGEFVRVQIDVAGAITPTVKATLR